EFALLRNQEFVDTQIRQKAVFDNLKTNEQQKLALWNKIGAERIGIEKRFQDRKTEIEQQAITKREILQKRSQEKLAKLLNTEVKRRTEAIESFFETELTIATRAANNEADQQKQATKELAEERLRQAGLTLEEIEKVNSMSLEEISQEAITSNEKTNEKIIEIVQQRTELEEKIEAEKDRRILESRLSLIETSVGRINTALEGIKDLKLAENAGETVSAVGKIGSALPGVAGQIGGIVGAVGTGISLVQELFDDSAEELAKQEARQKRIEELERLRAEHNQAVLDSLKAQSDLQLQLLQIQLKRNNLESESEDIQMMLNKIFIKDVEELKAANLEILKGKRKRLTGELGIQETGKDTPRALQRKAVELGDKSLSQETLITLINSATGNLLTSDLSDIKNKINSELGKGLVSAGVQAASKNAIDSINNIIASREKQAGAEGKKIRARVEKDIRGEPGGALRLEQPTRQMVENINAQVAEALQAPDVQARIREASDDWEKIAEVNLGNMATAIEGAA
ncbi:unnamed protein product, partial [marine sediment metagenome]